MNPDSLSYRHIRDAKLSGDNEVLSKISLRFAFQQLRLSGANRFAIIDTPSDLKRRYRLFLVIQSMGLGRITFQISWKHKDTGERCVKRVLLIPLLDDRQDNALKRHAKTVFVELGDENILDAAIRKIHLGWRPEAFDYPAQSFIEAIAEHCREPCFQHTNVVVRAKEQR